MWLLAERGDHPSTQQLINEPNYQHGMGAFRNGGLHAHDISYARKKGVERRNTDVRSPSAGSFLQRL